MRTTVKEKKSMIIRFGVMAVASVALAACGTVKVGGIARDRPTTTTQVASVPETTNNATQTPTTTAGQVTPKTAAVVESTPPSLAKGYGSAKDYVRDAVQSLQIGEVDAARDDIRAALKLDPNYGNAKSLLQQIDGDPIAMLGPKNFEYEIQAGDSLSSVSKQFLGDPLRFHILAKYNSIDNPSHLSVGQKIKVPGDRVSEATKGPKQPRTPQQQHSSTSVIAKAKRLGEEGKYTKGEELLEAELESEDLEDELPVQDALVALYLKHSDVLKRENKISAAQKILQKAAILQPTNTKVAAKIDSMKGQVADVDKVYKDAYAAYRRQQLEDAIRGFDRVLELDPHHELAKLYRARATELKDRLGSFAKE